ncbi:YbaN family protein [Staphylococcus sp. GDB20D115P1]|uniref:YbaN family protein n=1 Tax=Staphylococcus sp. GDB20D115P1 TaxID=2804085 RepID=UPI001AEC6B26|nr:YbaN family protein [Staphylococcus sp. GDB20D115P1]
MKLLKPLLLVLGILCTILGFLGSILPLLPTTSFILLAVLCFAKSSDKFHNWLVATKVYKNYIQSFKENKGYTMKQKLKMLISVYIVVGFSIFVIDITPIRVGLAFMLLCQTVVLFAFIKTLPKEYNTDD